jgi:hypothetical protein
MPWSLRRDGASVIVGISSPVDDWEDLMDEIHRNLDPMPTAVHIPKHLESSSAIDQELLDLLRASLVSQGAPLV